MPTTTAQDSLSGIATLVSTSGKTVSPFASLVLSSSNDSTDFVTCYVLNDNASAGTLDASALPPNSYIAPGGGTLVMISGGVATVQSALRALVFDAAPVAAGTTQSAHLSIVLTNTADGITAARTVVGNMVQNIGVNVALQGMPAASTVADTGATVLLPKLVVVSAGSDAVGVTVSLGSAANGAFDTGSVNGVALAANTDGSVTLTGTAAAVGAGLAALRFNPVSRMTGTTGTETVTLSARDLVNGTTASGTTTLSITGSQSAVSLSGTPSATTVYGGASTALFSSLSIQNRASGPLTASVTLGSTANGRFDRSQLASGTGTLSADGGTLVFSGSAADVQADLRALRFVGANPASGTLSETIGLALSTAGNGGASLTETVSVQSSGAAPVLAGIAGVQLPLGQSQALYPSATVSGPTTEVVATITLSDPSIAAFDQSAFQSAETGNSAIRFAFSGDRTSLQLTGSAAAVSTALRAVQVKTTTPASAVVSQEQAALLVVANAGTTSSTSTISVAGPALQTVSLGGVASTVAAVEGKTITPFAGASLNDPNTGDTVTLLVSSSVANLFDASSLGSGATLSADGRSVSITGSAALVGADLNRLALKLPSLSAAGSVSLSMQLGNRAGTQTLSSGTTTQTIAITAAGYTSDTGSDDTGRVFVVGGDPALTAVIDLENNPNGDIVVFGGNSALSLRAANTVLVLNGPHQNGAVSLTSLGHDAIWLGTGTVDCTPGGHDRFVLGAEDGTSSTAILHGGTAADASELDVWGDASELQTIRTDGVSSTTIFGGGARMDFTGGNSTVVLNGSGQTGDVSIHSIGGTTVWAGNAALNLYEGGGHDVVLLTGAAATTIHGNTAGTAGQTTVMSLSNSGAFTYDGGTEAASLSLSGGTNVVHGGSGRQDISMAGGGSLTVSDDGSSSGLQSIIMNQGSTATLRFLGGSNPATLVLGAGDASIKAGHATTVTGGSGAASIDLSDAAGAALSFNGSLSGNLDITGFDPSRATAALSSVVGSSVQGGSLVVAFADGAHAVFHGLGDASHAGISFG